MNAKTPLTMDDSGVVLDADGKQVAAILPGDMREVGREMCRAVNSLPALVKALEASRIYVADAVAHDGGIDNCQIEYRMDLELIDAALASHKTGG